MKPFFRTPKKKIDAEKLEESFRMAFDDVIWTSVKISGTKMTIDLQENIKNKERERPNDGKAYDIIAEKDAVIDTVITRQGAPQITAGTQVKKGDVRRRRRGDKLSVLRFGCGHHRRHNLSV